MVFLEYVDGFDLFRYIKRERMTGAIVRYICHQVG
jgi:serine/threonine protein kinase